MEEIKEQFYYPLGKRTFWIFILRRVGFVPLFFIIALAIILIKNFFAGSDIMAMFDSIINWVSIALFLIGGLMIVFGIIMALLENKTSRVMFDDSSFHIVKGALSKVETVIPYRRIQSVEIKQPVFYRILKLGHVVISTTTDLEQPNQADDENDEEVIPTVDYQLARMIEETLTHRAEIERVESVQTGRK
jgi:membrane protein YdbS with pleckstrin-like domain